MFCLVYKSIASPAFGKDQIQGMLEKARQFNNKNNVTGCLLFYKGEFVQYLEGKQVTILQLYDRIQVDDRHHEVTLLSHTDIEAREFDNWSMAYEDFLGDNDELQFLKLLVSSYFETPEKAMEPNPTSAYFWSSVRRLLQVNSEKRYS